MAGWLNSHGAYADLERVVPELYGYDEEGKLREARLDVVVRFPGDLHSHYIDVTVRGATGQDREPRVPGAAAESGSARKRERYGGRALPFSVELDGRLGKDAVRFISEAAQKCRGLAELEGDAGAGVAPARAARWPDPKPVARNNASPAKARG